MHQISKLKQGSADSGNLTKPLATFGDGTTMTTTPTKIADLLAMLETEQVELKIPHIRDLAQAARLSLRGK
jgi:hypothetical protein